MNDKTKKIRLLDALLEGGFATEPKLAKALIMSGQVVVNDQRMDKPGCLVDRDAEIRVKGQSQFVSRGGEKLMGAVEDFDISTLFSDAVVLDVGASTGGFTDCSLKLGARKVFAVDVGTNQLAWKLRNDERVKSMEQTDIRDISNCLDPNISIVVGDVSFTRLANVLPSILRASPDQGVTFVLLIKPQFEIDSSLVPEGGVVADDQLRQKAVDQVLTTLQGLGISEASTKDCRLAGRTGNREIFVCFNN